MYSPLSTRATYALEAMSGLTPMTSLLSRRCLSPALALALALARARALSVSLSLSIILSISLYLTLSFSLSHEHKHTHTNTHTHTHTQGANQALLDGLMVSEALHRHLSADRSLWIAARDHKVARLRMSLSSPDTRTEGHRDAAWRSARYSIYLLY
jgi:hypothetical protein